MVMRLRDRSLMRAPERIIFHGRSEVRTTTCMMLSAAVCVASAQPALGQSGGIMGTLRKLGQTAGELKRIGEGNRRAAPQSAPSIEAHASEGTDAAATLPSASPPTNAALFAETSGNTGDTFLAARPVIKGDPATFAVGGVKLGMSLNEVSRIVRAAGGRFDHFGPGLSFRSEVEMRVAEGARRSPPQARRMVAAASARLDDGIRYLIHFAQHPSGPLVSRVDLTIPWSGYTPASVRTSLSGRYGAPRSELGPGDRLFTTCWTRDRTCGSDLSFLQVSGGEQGIELRLEEGAMAARDREALIERHVVAATSAGRPANF